MAWQCRMWLSWGWGWGLAGAGAGAYTVVEQDWQFIVGWPNSEDGGGG